MLFVLLIFLFAFCRRTKRGGKHLTKPSLMAQPRPTSLLSQTPRKFRSTPWSNKTSLYQVENLAQHSNSNDTLSPNSMKGSLQDSMPNPPRKKHIVFINNTLIIIYYNEDNWRRIAPQLKCPLSSQSVLVRFILFLKKKSFRNTKILYCINNLSYFM